MPSRVSRPSDDVTVYLVLNDHGQFGMAYVETDPAEADRKGKPLGPRGSKKSRLTIRL